MVDVGGGARDHVSALLSAVRKTVSEESGRELFLMMEEEDEGC